MYCLHLVKRYNNMALYCDWIECVDREYLSFPSPLRDRQWSSVIVALSTWRAGEAYIPPSTATWDLNLWRMTKPWRLAIWSVWSVWSVWAARERGNSLRALFLRVILWLWNFATVASSNLSSRRCDWLQTEVNWYNMVYRNQKRARKNIEIATSYFWLLLKSACNDTQLNSNVTASKPGWYKELYYRTAYIL